MKIDNPVVQANEKVYYSPSKIGFFIGIISFFVVSFLSFGGSCCVTIFASVGIGALAGWSTARYSNIGIWDSASEFGGKSGRIAGVFVFLGHIAGSILPSLLFRMGGVVGVFSSDVANSAALNSAIIRSGIINGIIGFVILWITASFVSSKVYENDEKDKRN